ncbi:MAG: insulinase family protein, partial [Nannocystaceae bacterium]|nr:insulinase family protein [Nannocystaceae bacterium]
ADAIAAIVAQIQRLRQSGIEEEELSRAKAVLRSDLVYRRETTQGQAHVLGYYLSLAGDLDADRRYYEVLTRLSVQDVREACARLLAPSTATLGLVVPQQEMTAVQVRSLRRHIAACLRPAPKRSKASSIRLRERNGVSWVDLPCGVRLRALPDRRVPIAAAWLVWRGGLLREDARRHGATPVMAELLTRGCAEIDGDALAREIDGKAAVLDGFSGRSSAGLHVECMAADLPAILTRALQCAVAPNFAADELDEERRVALADFEAEDEDLSKVAVRDVLARLYTGHPFRFRRRGTPQTLGRLTATGLRKLWRQWYPLQDMVLGVAGDVELATVAELVESTIAEALAARPSDSRTPLPSLASRQWPRANENMILRAKEQAHIALAYPGLAVGDRRGPALEVLMAVLGGQAGRLFLRLREDEGLVYHVSAAASEGVSTGDVLLYAATGQDKVVRAREAIEAELAAVLAREVSASELARAQAWLSGQYEAALERRGRLASLVAFDEIFGLGVGTFFDYRRRIEAVTPRAVRAVARALLGPDRQIATVVSAQH